MRIVIDGRLILNQQTGIGRYLLGLLGGIQELGCTDAIEVWLHKDLAEDHPLWQLSAPNIALRRTPLRHMDALAQAWAPGELLRNRPDVYHYPHFDLPWLAPGRVVLTIHDLKYLSNSDFFVKKGRLKRLVMRRLLAHALKKAQQVIAVSQFSTDDLEKRLNLERRKIRVIPHGVDARFFQRCRVDELERLRQKYRLAPQYLLFVGERRPHKNLTGLIHAFSLLQKMGSPAQLVIAGKAYAGYQQPEKLAERLGLAQQVRFLDYVDEADLPGLYQAASLFTLLSHYEGFGLPVLEAMASGTPVVAANCTALPEVVGDAGVLVQPVEVETTGALMHRTNDGGATAGNLRRPDNDEAAAAFRLLLAPTPERKALIRRGLERAAQFSWTACAQRTLAVYHEGNDDARA